MVNKTYVVYDDTGKIQHTINTPENQAPTVNALEVEGGDMLDISHYVDLETITLREKKAVDLSHTISGLSVAFSFLPVDTKVFIKGQGSTVDAEGLEIEFDMPGTYEIYIDPPPQYKAETLEVTIG